MGAELHTFDPDGDLLLILSRRSNDTESNIDSAGEDTANTPPESEAHINGGDDALNTEITSETAAKTEVKGAGNAIGTSTNVAGNASGLDSNTGDEEEPAIPVHMLVSSRHMMLASPVFKAMLQEGTFEEGRKLTSIGKVEIPLPDDDPDAFEVVLGIIHGRNRRVPRDMDLDSLTDISILVDKYQMTEAIESFSDGWIDGLYKNLPTKYTNEEETHEVHQWLGISWVFSKEKGFKKMSELVEQGCYADLVDDIREGLPIPDLIVESILKKRQDALFELYSMIEETIRRYQRRDVFCPRTDNKEWALLCDSLILGSLLKSASNLGILPVPEAPYRDISFDALTAQLYSLKVTAICDDLKYITFAGKAPKPAHGLHETIDERIKILEQRLSGLDIQEFKAKEKSPRPVVGV